MPNVLLRFVDWVGEGTLSSAERAYRRAQEVSLVLKEQDEAARAVLGRKAVEGEERRKALEEKLSRIKEVLEVEEAGEEEVEFKRESEELKIPLSTRLADSLAGVFAGRTKPVESFYRGIQEDLYKANIFMPVSKYIALSLGISLVAALGAGVLFTVALGSAMGLQGALLGLALAVPVFGLAMFFTKMHPKSKVKGRSEAFGRELPFALRHMATQLSSGSGLLETMRSISQSEYGVLSEEFKRAVREIDRGATIEESYERMNIRIESPGLKKASRQIISTLRTGGNLANTLKIIAEEVSMEMRMKLKDFIQVLNSFSLIYMFVVVVAPVLITTLVIAMGIALKHLPIPPATIWLLYMAFFGISVYMTFMVKKFEPKV
ncbi:MAG: type II secretion system F family protein [Euryarchaeota archaeon]|nr:type II secretion system F family protein [Euryarchaeota archaeon]